MNHRQGVFPIHRDQITRSLSRLAGVLLSKERGVERNREKVLPEKESDEYIGVERK